MRVLLVGLGSIGRRHLECLFAGKERLEIAALRSGKGELKLPVDILELATLAEALAFQPDGVIISNPTSLHVSAAQPFLEAGSMVLIEKPIAATLQEAKKLMPFRNQIRVAYCLRFHCLYQLLGEIFQKEEAFKVSFRRSYFLPKWHPYADYRKEYTARKELGGGVIRTLSHEIDLSLHWFGTPVSSIGICDKISFLEIDVDDFAFFSLKTGAGARVNFELDFFSPVNVNTGEAFTAEGIYQWDMRSLWFTKYSEAKPKQLVKLDEGAFDAMYLNQSIDFLKFLSGGGSNSATFDQALEVMKVIEEIDG